MSLEKKYSFSLQKITFEKLSLNSNDFRKTCLADNVSNEVVFTRAKDKYQIPALDETMALFKK